MDIILLIQAVIMGIVEGITEFLPISSTGYLILSADVMGFWTKEKVDLFVVVVQLGAILAVIYDYWGRLWQTCWSYSANSVAPLPAIGRLSAVWRS